MKDELLKHKQDLLMLFTCGTTDPIEAKKRMERQIRFYFIVTFFLFSFIFAIFILLVVNL